MLKQTELTASYKQSEFFKFIYDWMWQLEIQMLKYRAVAIVWVPCTVEISADHTSVFIYHVKSLNQRYCLLIQNHHSWLSLIQCVTGLFLQRDPVGDFFYKKRFNIVLSSLDCTKFSQYFSVLGLFPYNCIFPIFLFC